MKSKRLNLLSLLAITAMLFACDGGNQPSSVTSSTGGEQTSEPDSTPDVSSNDEETSSGGSSEDSSEEDSSSEEELGYFIYVGEDKKTEMTESSTEDPNVTVQYSGNVSLEEGDEVIIKDSEGNEFLHWENAEQDKAYVAPYDGDYTFYFKLYQDGGDATWINIPENPYSTIAEAQEAEEGTTVTVKGVVVAVNTAGYLLSDGTGKIVVFLNKTPSVAIGDYLKVTGELSERYGNMQFTSSATVTTAKGTAPEVSETASVWGTAEVDEFIGKEQTQRGLGYYITMTGKVVQSGNYYNVQLEGTTNEGSLSYLPTSLSAQVTSGDVYKVTGYVTDVSVSGNISRVNIYTTELEHVDFADVESVVIDGEQTRTIDVGGSIQLSTTVLPFLANSAVTWSSDDQQVAIVTSDGVVNALEAGTANITATTVGLDASGVAKTAAIELTVNASDVQTDKDTWTYTADSLTVSDKKVQFETTNFDFEWLQNTSTSAIRTDYASMRFYVGHKLVISAKEGQQIASVVFNLASDNTNTDNTTNTAAAYGADGQALEGIVKQHETNNITYNLISAGNATKFELVGTKQTRFASIEVVYVVE